MLQRFGLSAMLSIVVVSTGMLAKTQAAETANQTIEATSSTKVATPVTKMGTKAALVSFGGGYVSAYGPPCNCQTSWGPAYQVSPGYYPQSSFYYPYPGYLTGVPVPTPTPTPPGPAPGPVPFQVQISFPKSDAVILNRKTDSIVETDETAIDGKLAHKQFLNGRDSYTIRTTAKYDEALGSFSIALKKADKSDLKVKILAYKFASELALNRTSDADDSLAHLLQVVLLEPSVQGGIPNSLQDLQGSARQQIELYLRRL